MEGSIKKGMEFNAKTIDRLVHLGIVTVYLFGSRAQGIARKNSDYDFGVLVNPSLKKQKNRQELYQKIYDLFQDLIGEKLNIDIIFLDQAPMQLRYHVIRFGKVLLDADPSERGRFEETTLEEHADFEPYRRMFEEATLARIP